MKYTDEKIKNFQAYMKHAKISGCAVTDNDGVNYLSDFNFVGEGDAFLFITLKQAYCFTKQLYAIDVKNKAKYLTLVDSLDCEDIVKLAKKLKLKNCVFDTTCTAYIPGTLFYKNGFKEMPGIISANKEVKTKTEIARISKACSISAKAYDIFRKRLKVGMTELQACALLENIMKELGGEGLAFPTIMAFGPESANPHHTNTDRKLKAEDVVLMDYGCRWGGYCSDITRTFWFGKKPSAEFTKMFDIVKSAYDLGVKLVKPGVAASVPHNSVMELFDNKGKLAKYFIHSLGHSLGTAIHEKPYLNTRSKEVLKAGNVVTVEPGLYFEGKFGIRYENTVLVTEKSSKILTK